MTDEAGAPSALSADPGSAAGTGRGDWDPSRRPQVAGSGRRPDLWLTVGGAILLGLVTLFLLSSHRTSGQNASLSAAKGDALASPPPPPQDLANYEAAARSNGVPASPQVATAVPVAVSTPTLPLQTAAALPSGASDDRGKAPAMVVDLGEASPSAATPAPSVKDSAGGAKPAAAAPAVGAGAANPSGLNGDEQFAERVSAAEPDRSEATVIHNLKDTIPQGAMIPGVMETALDSDLPGYARAVVSRDVRGFDGSTVLVPRGSRVIGQYKSAVAQGQSRAFVIWTRILRPDGASIQIGSSGTDPLGRAGLEGSVNRHFFERFGGSILLSVINAGITSLASRPSTEIVIGSSQDATSVALAAILPTNISPTIKVPQGAPIRIFVARDLDFSPVGGVGH